MIKIFTALFLGVASCAVYNTLFSLPAPDAIFVCPLREKHSVMRSFTFSQFSMLNWFRKSVVGIYAVLCPGQILEIIIRLARIKIRHSGKFFVDSYC